MRDELELQLLSELRRSGCFRSIEKGSDTDATASDAAVLRLKIGVLDFFEETVYDTSIAQRADPRAPQELQMLHTSRFHLLLEVSLEHPGSARALRTKRLRGNGSHRPLMLGDDARLRALGEAAFSAAEGVRRFVCKGGAKRLSKEIGSTSGP
jgi:hypothetical protein